MRSPVDGLSSAPLKAGDFTERDLRRMRLLASLTEVEMKQASATTCAEVVGRPLTEQEELFVSGAGAVARGGLRDSVIVPSQTSGISRRVMLRPGEPSPISPEREAERLRLSIGRARCCKRWSASLVGL
jgi:hypothetical protein